MDSDGLDLACLFPSVQTMPEGCLAFPFLSWRGTAGCQPSRKATLGHFPTSHFSRALSLPLHGEVQMTWPSARTTSCVHLALSGPRPERHLDAPSLVLLWQGGWRLLPVGDVYSPPPSLMTVMASQQALRVLKLGWYCAPVFWHVGQGF